MYYQKALGIGAASQGAVSSALGRSLPFVFLCALEVSAGVNRDNVAVSVRGKKFVGKEHVLSLLRIRQRE
jgi:hypothetical protein